MNRPTYILDFDSTLVQCESLDELARISLSTHANQHSIMHELEQLTHQAMSGEINFDDALRARLQLFAATKQDIQSLITYLRSHISPSALKAQTLFAENRINMYIVSGGFEEYILPIAAQLNIPASHVYANRFLFKDDRVTGFDTSRHTSQPGGKATQVATLRLFRPLIVIGDGFTDYEVKAAGVADKFWAFTETIERPHVSKKADRIVRSFSEVLIRSGANV